MAWEIHTAFKQMAPMKALGPAGSLKQPWANVGIAYITALIKTSLLAWDKSLSSHPCNFFHTLSLMKLKLGFLPLSTKARSPKYFSLNFIFWTPKTLIISCLASSCVDLLNKSATSKKSFVLRKKFDNISTLLWISPIKKKAIVCKKTNGLAWTLFCKEKNHLSPLILLLF